MRIETYFGSFGGKNVFYFVVFYFGYNNARENIRFQVGLVGVNQVPVVGRQLIISSPLDITEKYFLGVGLKRFFRALHKNRHYVEAQKQVCNRHYNRQSQSGINQSNQTYSARPAGVKLTIAGKTTINQRP